MTFHSENWKTIIQTGAAEFEVPIGEGQIDMMATHARELMVWNRKKNLTAILDPDDIAVKHFIDSIYPARWIPDHASVIDIGTGGGFPGIPLKIVKPSLSLTLVDASRKKINFVKHVIRTLALENIQAIHARIEDLAEDPAYQNAFDFSISRAFTELKRFVDLASPLVGPGGKLIAMKSRNVTSELDAIAASHPQAVVRNYILPFHGARRCLVIL